MMFSMVAITGVALIVIRIAMVVVSYGLRMYSRSQTVRRFARLHGCQEAPAQYKPAWDFLSITTVVSMVGKFWEQQALQSTMELFDTYGETYCTTIFRQRVFFTCNSLNIKHILTTAFPDFDSAAVRAHIFKPIAANGILATDGAEWKVTRDLYRKQFSSTRSIAQLEMQERHIQKFIARIPAGEPVDLQPLFMDLILDITSELLLGDSVDSQSPTQSAEKSRFVDDLAFVKCSLAKHGFVGPLHILLRKKQFYKACNNLRQYVEVFIKEALEQKHRLKEAEKPQGYTFLKGLTTSTEDVEQLRDGIISILLAGIDTVANLLSSTFWLLAQDDEVLRKVRAEISEKIGKESPNYEQLKTLIYLRYVFNEAMRLYPPVPFNARMANKDTILPFGGGVDGSSPIMIKKGERVVFSSWASHRNVRTFGENAHEFHPERWEHPKSEEQGYVPFNSGPRICPGQQFALVEASYAVVRILQTFSQLKPQGACEWVEKIGLSLSNDKGVHVSLQ